MMMMMTTTTVSETAILAGGCFWGMEDLFRKQEGVLSTQVGYCGDSEATASYAHVKTGATQHAEAVQVVFNPSQTSYEALLRFFFQIHNPCTPNQQGNDVGPQYRSIIFYTTPQQQAVAQALMARMAAARVWPAPLATALLPAPPFYPAEAEHPAYLQRFPHGYSCHWVRPNWVLP